ncbi:MAG: dTMP kinase [Chloroflexi bacterium]|nr:dTMP kinase [Chloroflexota bacterium]
MSDDSFFIVIEGMDCAGKTANAWRLFDVLFKSHSGDVLLTSEPDEDSLLGGELRKALASQISLSPVTLAQAFAINRMSHLETLIEPFLNCRRRIVICDRYLLSSLVYQAAGDVSMTDVLALNRWARPPDLTIYLAISPLEAATRLRRRQAEPDLFENNFAQRAEKYATAVAMLRDQGERIIEVDANPAFPQVFDTLLSALKTQGPDWLRIQPPLF